MKRLRWKESHGGKYAKVDIGSLELSCSTWYTAGEQLRYLPQVSISHCVAHRIGGLQKSMCKCKEEAIEMAKELLEDYYVAIKTEMANFEGCRLTEECIDSAKKRTNGKWIR